MAAEPFRAYLVDDEPLALERLQRLLSARLDVEVIGSTTDPATALAFLSSQDCDPLFLDIQMPGMNGFELLSALPKPPPVIFTTAHDEYALRGFQVNAIDYLLKPIDAEQLDRALDKLHRLRGSQPSWMRGPDVHSLLAKLSSALRQANASYPSRIASRLGDRITVIDLGDVTHFFARDKLTYAAVHGQQHSVDETISDLERKLDPVRFIRIHRSILLNVDWLRSVNTAMTGNAVVMLKDARGTQLPISRDRMRELKQRLGL